MRHRLITGDLDHVAPASSRSVFTKVSDPLLGTASLETPFNLEIQQLFTVLAVGALAPLGIGVKNIPVPTCIPTQGPGQAPCRPF
jgi:hypothetical protein